jgi:hypothetical protein
MSSVMITTMLGRSPGIWPKRALPRIPPFSGNGVAASERGPRGEPTWGPDLWGVPVAEPGDVARSVARATATTQATLRFLDNGSPSLRPGLVIL